MKSRVYIKAVGKLIAKARHFRAHSTKSVLLLPFVTTDKRKSHSGSSVTAIELSLKRKDEKAQPRGLSGTAIEVLLKRKGEKADSHGMSATTLAAWQNIKIKKHKLPCQPSPPSIKTLFSSSLFIFEIKYDIISQNCAKEWYYQK